VSESTMVPNLLKTLQVISEPHVEGIGDELIGTSVLVILLSVEKPLWDLELLWITYYRHQVFQLSCRKLSSSFVHIDVCLLADEISKTATDTLNGCQCKHYLLASIDIGVEDTKNVLKLFVGYERHFRRNRLTATMPSVVSSAQDQMDERLYMLAIKPYLEP